VRWAQFGSLSGIMRFHGVGVREPWAYPDPHGAAAVEACRLRRRLRPYLVAAARAAARTGAPLMRPMPLAHPEHRAAREAELQYLLGPDVLVAPVVEPGGRVAVWVPPGTWTPLHSPDVGDLRGPGWSESRLALDVVPAWKRQGSRVL
jgi:alpha-D-xyloside xylohydrolase